jgi:hypothetical protein
MKNYEATERAFKNGYEKGYEDGKPKWIPVSERLPDKDVRVLCYRPGQFYEMVVAKLDEYGWERWGKDHNTNEDVITHWMPLPELPKEGE